jgi:hypothetical protein
LLVLSVISGVGYLLMCAVCSIRKDHWKVCWQV